MILPILANSPSKLAEKNTLLRLSNSCFFFCFFFSIRVFFHGHWRLTGQQGKGGDHLLFHSTTSTRSRTFRHLFATLHVRWLSHIFNHIACIYQTATLWDLPPYRITILIDWWCDIKCLFMWWFDSSFFVIAIWVGKPVDSNLHRLFITLQVNRLTKCASHLKTTTSLDSFEFVLWNV